MEFQIRRFPKVLLASAVLFAASFVSSPAQAAVEVNIACSGGGTFKVVDNMVMAGLFKEAKSPVSPSRLVAS
jgi:hypothetical protein